MRKRENVKNKQVNVTATRIKRGEERNWMRKRI